MFNVDTNALFMEPFPKKLLCSSILAYAYASWKSKEVSPLLVLNNSWGEGGIMCKWFKYIHEI